MLAGARSSREHVETMETEIHDRLFHEARTQVYTSTCNHTYRAFAFSSEHVTAREGSRSSLKFMKNDRRLSLVARKENSYCSTVGKPRRKGTNSEKVCRRKDRSKGEERGGETNGVGNAVTVSIQRTLQILLPRTSLFLLFWN